MKVENVENLNKSHNGYLAHLEIVGEYKDGKLFFDEYPEMEVDESLGITLIR